MRSRALLCLAVLLRNPVSESRHVLPSSSSNCQYLPAQAIIDYPSQLRSALHPDMDKVNATPVVLLDETGNGSQGTRSLQLLLEVVRAEALEVVVATDMLSADPSVGHAALSLGVRDLVLVEALLEGVLDGGAVACVRAKVVVSPGLISQRERGWRVGENGDSGSGSTHCLRSARGPCT